MEREGGREGGKGEGGRGRERVCSCMCLLACVRASVLERGR